MSKSLASRCGALSAFGWGRGNCFLYRSTQYYCIDTTNPAVTSHHKFCRRRNWLVTVKIAVSLAARHQSPSELPSAWRHVTSHRQNYRQPGSTSPVTIRTAVSLAARHKSLPELLSAWWYIRISVSLVVCQNFHQPGSMSP